MPPLDEGRRCPDYPRRHPHPGGYHDSLIWWHRSTKTGYFLSSERRVSPYYTGLHQGLSITPRADRKADPACGEAFVEVVRENGLNIIRIFFEGKLVSLITPLLRGSAAPSSPLRGKGIHTEPYSAAVIAAGAAVEGGGGDCAFDIPGRVSNVPMGTRARRPHPYQTQ